MRRASCRPGRPRRRRWARRCPRARVVPVPPTGCSARWACVRVVCWRCSSSTRGCGGTAGRSLRCSGACCAVSCCTCCRSRALGMGCSCGVGHCAVNPLSPAVRQRCRHTHRLVVPLSSVLMGCTVVSRVSAQGSCSAVSRCHAATSGCHAAPAHPRAPGDHADRCHGERRVICRAGRHRESHARPRVAATPGVQRGRHRCATHSRRGTCGHCGVV